MSVLEASSLVAAAVSSAPITPITRQLLFSNTLLSFGLLVACFLVALAATLMPFACLRREQFTRRAVMVLSVWHALIAGVLLAAAFTVFLPNMLAVADRMTLPTPALPFVLLLLALLFPLVLDKAMLWLVATRPGKKSDEVDAQTEPDTPASVPTTPMQQQRFTPRTGATPTSRKPSVIGGTAGVAEFDERKSGRLSLSRASRTGSRAGDPENQPLTAGDIEVGAHLTPYGTPGPHGVGATYYGSAALSVDALEFKARQAYLARCAFCKENITTGKGLAYHAAGCALRSFHAFSLSSRWMQGLRGRRSAQREVVLNDEEAAIGAVGMSSPPARVGATVACYVLVLTTYNVALAGGVNLQQAAMMLAAHHGATDLPAFDADSWPAEVAHILLVGLVMFCFTWFYGFSLGMMLRLHRIALGNWRAWIALIAYAASLPAAIVINYVVSAHLPSKGAGAYTYESYLLVCQAACVGVLIYTAFVDMVLEEWSRRDALPAKTAAFAVGATLVCAVVILTPL